MLDATGRNCTVEDAGAPASDLAAERFDAIVLGAGVSGLVAASVLLEQGCRRILVVDEYDHVGGNHIDQAIGPYTFDVGSFIFQDDSPLVERFPELLPHYVPIDPRWGRLNPQGVVTAYPFSVKADLIDAGPLEWGRILASVVVSRLFRRRLRNARDFAQHWIGKRLLWRSGLERYMERFYGQPAEKIDIRFAEKRMLWIKEYSLLRTHVKRLLKTPEYVVTNKQQARPQAGFAPLYQPAVEGLRARGATFRLGARLRRLRKADPDFVLEADGRDFIAARLISTLPLDHIGKLYGLAGETGLQTVTLMSLFFSFSGERRFTQSILYNFSLEGAWKRLTVYSDFYGRSADREYFAVEVNADHANGCVETAEQDFRRHVAANGLFQGNLRLEGSHQLGNAYPVYTGGAPEKVEAAIAGLRAVGIESIGRQGRFDYQPTARATTLEAEAALNPASSAERR